MAAPAEAGGSAGIGGGLVAASGSGVSAGATEEGPDEVRPTRDGRGRTCCAGMASSTVRNIVARGEPDARK